MNSELEQDVQPLAESGADKTLTPAQEITTNQAVVPVMEEAPSDDAAVDDDIAVIKKARRSALRSRSEAQKYVSELQQWHSDWQAKRAQLDKAVNDATQVVVGGAEKLDELRNLADELQDKILLLEETHASTDDLQRTAAELQVHASNVSESADKSQVEANASLEAAKEASVSAASLMEKVAALQSNLETETSNLSKQQESLEAVMEAARSSASKAEVLAQAAERKNAEIEAAAKSHAEFMERVEHEMEAIQRKAEATLASATSASLATSFSNRAKKLATTEGLLLIAFLVVAVSGAILVYSLMLTPGVKSVGDYLVRAPMFVLVGYVLVWLGSRYRDAARRRELYEHKASASQSFEGYRDQLAELHNSDLMVEFARQVIAIIGLNPAQSDVRKPDDGPMESLVQNAVEQSDILRHESKSDQ